MITNIEINYKESFNFSFYAYFGQIRLAEGKFSINSLDEQEAAKDAIKLQIAAKFSKQASDIRLSIYNVDK